MKIYQEAVVPNEDLEGIFKLIGQVVHFNKCYYQVCSVDCDPMKGHPLTLVRVHFSPHIHPVNEVYPLPLAFTPQP